MNHHLSSCSAAVTAGKKVPIFPRQALPGPRTVTCLDRLRSRTLRTVQSATSFNCHDWPRISLEKTVDQAGNFVRLVSRHLSPSVKTAFCNLSRRTFWPGNGYIYRANGHSRPTPCPPLCEAVPRYCWSTGRFRTLSLLDLSSELHPRREAIHPNCELRQRVCVAVMSGTSEAHGLRRDVGALVVRGADVSSSRNGRS